MLLIHNAAQACVGVQRDFCVVSSVIGAGAMVFEVFMNQTGPCSLSDVIRWVKKLN